MQKLITLFEYSSLNYQISKDPATEGFDEKDNVLHITKETLEQLDALIQDVPFMEIYHDRIYALNYAGVAKIGSLKIEILPKFFKKGDIENSKPAIMRNLLYMLQYSETFSFREISNADLDELKNDFLEVMVFLFAKNLAQLLRTKQDRQYIQNQDELRFVREKIVTKKYGSNPARLHIIPCEFHDRSMNTFMNRTFRFTAQTLLHQVKNPETYRYLKFILSIFDEVDSGRIYPSDIRKIRLNRMNQVFRPYVKFCELFLSHSTITLQASKVDFFSLMIPMEKLFENFIAEMLRTYQKKIFPNGSIYQIKPQHDLGSLVYENGKEFFSMIPDIYLDGIPPIILDTKYKMLSSDDRKSNISQQDLYQMYAYCRESGVNIAILLYPSGINTEIPDRIFKLGREQSIELHITSISLDYDLSQRKEVEEFVKELAQKFVFLRRELKISPPIAVPAGSCR